MDLTKLTREQLIEMLQKDVPVKYKEQATLVRELVDVVSDDPMIQLKNLVELYEEGTTVFVTTVEENTRYFELPIEQREKVIYKLVKEISSSFKLRTTKKESEKVVESVERKESNVPF